MNSPVASSFVTLTIDVIVNTKVSSRYASNYNSPGANLSFSLVSARSITGEVRAMV